MLLSIAALLAALAIAASEPPAATSTELAVEGVRLLNEGDLAGAIETLEAATQADPANARAWNALGATLNRAEKYLEAVDAAEKAVALASDDARYRLNLGLVYWEVGRFKEALAALDFATAALPDLALGWVERGAVLVSLGRYDEARASWDRAEEADPGYPWTDYYRSGLAFADGDFDEAARRLDSLLSNTDFGPARMWRWVVEARRGNAPAALAEIDGWPGSVARFLSGEIDAAMLEAEAGRQRLYDDRRLVSALHFIGQKHLAEGRREEGLEVFRRALSLASPRHLERIIMERTLAAAP